MGFYAVASPEVQNHASELDAANTSPSTPAADQRWRVDLTDDHASTRDVYVIVSWAAHVM